MKTEQLRPNYYVTRYTMINGEVICGFSEFMSISMLNCYALVQEVLNVKRT